MQLTGIVTKNIIRKLMAGEDYRAEVVALIDAVFLQYVIDFFKRVAAAKLDNRTITTDWYRSALLGPDLPKEELAIHSGLNMKTISNMYGSGAKPIVLEASLEHYDTLYGMIESLIEQDDIGITLTIKIRNVAVELNISESLVVINTIAVMRAALRGGLWSTAGKQVEKPLMVTLCALLRVPLRYCHQSDLPGSDREIDFYLTDRADQRHKCEVKLMGKGNPESADGALARGSRIFIADTLSDLNKRSLDEQNILWVEMRGADVLQQFGTRLQQCGIPCQPFTGNLRRKLDRVFDRVLSDDSFSSTTPSIVRAALSEDSPEYLIDFLPEDEEE